MSIKKMLKRTNFPLNGHKKMGDSMNHPFVKNYKNNYFLSSTSSKSTSVTSSEVAVLSSPCAGFGFAP